MSLRASVAYKVQQLSPVVGLLVIKSEYILYYCVEEAIEIELSRSLGSMKESEMTDDAGVSTSRLVPRECQFFSENLEFAEYAELAKLRTPSLWSSGSISSTG